MLLQAEWKPEVQAFVKVEHSSPDESDGFVWPAPTFRFFTREGVEIEGRDKARKIKMAHAGVPWMNAPQVFPSAMQSIGQASIKTASEVRMKMDEVHSRINASMRKVTDDMAKQMQQNIDSHLLDAMMYGQSLTYNTQDDLKVLRPRNIYGEDKA